MSWKGIHSYSADIHKISDTCRETCSVHWFILALLSFLACKEYVNAGQSEPNISQNHKQSTFGTVDKWLWYLDTAISHILHARLCFCSWGSDAECIFLHGGRRWLETVHLVLRRLQDRTHGSCYHVASSSHIKEPYTIPILNWWGLFLLPSLFLCPGKELLSLEEHPNSHNEAIEHESLKWLKQDQPSELIYVYKRL